MAVCMQDLTAVRSVREQLAQFRKSMEADGVAQRSECRRLVGTAVRRAGWLVDEVLQVMPCCQRSEEMQKSGSLQSRCSAHGP